MEKLPREPEHSGPTWKHPYFLYIIITAILALILGIIAWLAQSNDWIPKR
jgi:hypothetical protein